MARITEERLNELNCSTITDREIRKLVKAYRKRGGWIEWGGGHRPVPPDTMVEVKYRDGKNDAPYRTPNKGRAERYVWYDTGGATDIIAYRVVK